MTKDLPSDFLDCRAVIPMSPGYKGTWWEAERELEAEKDLQARRDEREEWRERFLCGVGHTEWDTEGSEQANKTECKDREWCSQRHRLCFGDKEVEKEIRSCTADVI